MKGVIIYNCTTENRVKFTEIIKKVTKNEINIMIIGSC